MQSAEGGWLRRQSTTVLTLNPTINKTGLQQRAQGLERAAGGRASFCSSRCLVAGNRLEMGCAATARQHEHAYHTSDNKGPLSASSAPSVRSLTRCLLLAPWTMQHSALDLQDRDAKFEALAARLQEVWLEIESMLLVGLGRSCMICPFAHVCPAGTLCTAWPSMSTSEEVAGELRHTCLFQFLRHWTSYASVGHVVRCAFVARLPSGSMGLCHAYSGAVHGRDLPCATGSKILPGKI